MARNVQFTDADKGCYIDGANGLDHACKVLADLITNCTQPRIPGYISGIDAEIPQLQAILRKGIDAVADDHSEIEMATDILTMACPDNLMFVWEAGDLLLVDTLEHELV